MADRKHTGISAGIHAKLWQAGKHGSVTDVPFLGMAFANVRKVRLTSKFDPKLTNTAEPSAFPLHSTEVM
jgi:hypothetical protein